MSHYKRALPIFPCDTTTVERLSRGKGSPVIIILLMLHSSPDGPHLSIPSLLPSRHLHFHISLSSSVSSHRLIFFCLSGEQTRAERRETQRDKEEAKDDKNKLEYGNGQTDLSKKREVLCLSSLEVFVITGPCLYEQTGFRQRIHLEYVLPALEHFSLSSH